MTCLLAVFVADIAWPLGAVIGLLYVVISISGFFISARDAFILASIATGASVLGYALAPPVPIPEWIVAASRAGSVFATWLLIITGIHFHKQSQGVIAAIRESNERRRLALEGAELAFWDLDVPAGVFAFDADWVAVMG